MEVSELYDALPFGQRLCEEGLVRILICISRPVFLSLSLSASLLFLFLSISNIQRVPHAHSSIYLRFSLQSFLPYALSSPVPLTSPHPAGGGYVLSREATRKFVEEALTDEKKCKSSPHGAEDAEIGKYLQSALHVICSIH